jgi:MoxR-like ATPase
MLKLKVGYPKPNEERLILDRMSSTQPLDKVSPVVDLPTILETRKLVDAVRVDNAVRDYIVQIVLATRNPETRGLAPLKGLIRFGASPRATIALTLAAKAWAVLDGRAYVVPDDIKTIGPDVLRHRIILSYEAEAEEVTTEDIVQKISTPRRCRKASHNIVSCFFPTTFVLRSLILFQLCIVN